MPHHSLFSLTKGRGGIRVAYRYDNRMHFNSGQWHNQLPKISLVYVSLAARLAGCQRGGRGFRSLVIHLNVDPKIYSQIVRDKTISDGAFRVWHLLRDMLGNKDHCWPSYETICDAIGCSKSSLNGWIQELIKGQYLTVKRGSRHASNRYSFSGIILNHRGSKSNRSGIVSAPELNQHNVNQKNGELPGALRISLEKELEASKEERDAIRRNCAQDAFGSRYYDAREKTRLSELNARIPKLEAKLHVEF